MRICEELRTRPTDFIQLDHVLHDNKTGVDYWTWGAGLWGGYKVFRPQKIPFTLSECWKFHFALKRWQRGMKTYLAQDCKERNGNN